MEKKNRVTRKERVARLQKAKILTGILIVLFGVLFLLRRIGIDIPSWFFSWKLFLIAIGIVLLYKHQFKHFGGYVLITIGSVFILNDYYHDLIDVSLLLPLFIIAFGVVIIVKASNIFGNRRIEEEKLVSEEKTENGDFVEVSAIFGNVKKNIVSKNFKGGDLSTAFGGVQLNLVKADIQGQVTINSDIIFGGMKLYIPPTWDVKIETTAIFGGVEDKRSVLDDNSIDPSKTIILTGNCIFGGIEIVNYF